MPRTSRRHPLNRLLAIALAAAAASCGRHETTGTPKPRPALAASSAPADAPLPPDRLAKDELAEGTIDAMGIKLPRGFKVVRSFDDLAAADGPAQPEPVANYLRRRVEAANVEIGPTSTVFVGAHAKGRPERTLRIDVFGKNGGTEIILRDLTPPAIDPNLTEEQRWKKHGLRPDGTPIDPRHME